MRTGKIDYLQALVYDDAKLLEKQRPDMNSIARYTWHLIPAGRTDQPPFDDIRVRQAMNLVVNQQELLDDYYQGDADMLAWPFPDTGTYEPYYTSLEEMPEEVKMLYTYDVDKAKQLMAQAGYPEGFKTTIICRSRSEEVDMLSVIKEYLMDINIDMAIEPIESGAWTSIRTGQQQKPGNMFYAAGVYSPDQPLSIKPGTLENHGFVNDPYYNELMLAIGRDIIRDPQNFQKTIKDAIVHQLASAWGIWLPRAHVYDLWWPWVKDYNGVSNVGWYGAFDWNKFIWVDQKMKRSMGY